MFDVLTPDKIKKPLGALIHRAPEDTAWFLGAQGDFQAINASGDWRPFITEFVLQRNGNFDDWSCVTYSAIAQAEILLNYQSKETTKWSRRYVSVLSGTKPNQGNSVFNVCEFLRKSGDVKEDDCPTMTSYESQADFFAPISQDVQSKELFLKEGNSYAHAYLPLPVGSQFVTLQDLINGLKISPIMVSVEGNYVFNNGKVVWGDGDIDHEVLIVAIADGVAYVLDSENNHGCVPFDSNYPFQFPKVGAVKTAETVKTAEIVKKKIAVNSLRYEPPAVTNYSLPNQDPMKIVHNQATGEILFVDPSNTGHHIPDELTFKTFFGADAWNKKEWDEVDPGAFASITQGAGFVSISPPVLAPQTPPVPAVSTAPSIQIDAHPSTPPSVLDAVKSLLAHWFQ